MGIAAGRHSSTTDASPTLARAHTFLTNCNIELTPLWLGKTLYCVQPLTIVLHTTATRRIEELVQ